MQPIQATEPPSLILMNPTAFAKEVGSRIAEQRKQQGLSQASLADACGFSQQMIGDYETGRRRIPACNLAAIGEVLGISAAELLGDSGGAKRRPGPAAKLDRLTEQISKLPRSRQRFVIEMIEDAVARAQ